MTIWRILSSCYIEILETTRWICSLLGSVCNISISLSADYFHNCFIANFMRVQWIDIVKGIGILLVCLGHSRLGSVGPLASWINSFHMPLFFIMAGLCFDEGRYQSLKGYVWRKCRVLAYPYFMLSLFVATIMTLLCWGSGVNYFDTILVRVFPGQTISGLWFVRVLFFVEIS